MHGTGDTIEVREVLGTLRRGWRWLLVGTLIGVAGALALSLLLPPRYEASSKVLLRNGSDSPGLPLPGMSGLGSLLPKSMQSGFDTELELLMSRTGVEAVVDSLLLQIRVVRPHRLGAHDLFLAASFDPGLVKPVRYRFVREGEGYRVSWSGGEARAIPGTPLTLPGGTLTLGSGALPESFRIRILPRPEAVRRIASALEAGNPGGDVAELVFRANDPVTAAAVPNHLVAFYMHRRRTTDRGVNQQRFEFLLARVDSVQTQLAEAEQALRRNQEESGIFDPQLYAKADLERAVKLRGELEGLTMESQALSRLVQAGVEGAIAPRDLAAYPTFLRNEAINDLLSRLLELEQERLELLERRTPVDPDVLAYDERIAALESQLVSLSTAYLNGLAEQGEQIRRELDVYERSLAEVPGLAQSALRHLREVERLSEISLVLHAQLLEARLDAIREGGEIREIDPAIPPHRPAFPNLPLNLGIGLFGGLFLGVLGAFGRTLFSERIDHPHDIERAAGVPALRFRPGAPLLLANVGGCRGVLLLPLGGSGPELDRVAGQIAGTAALRGQRVARAVLRPGSDSQLPGGLRRTSTAPRPEASREFPERSSGADGSAPSEHPSMTATLRAEHASGIALRVLGEGGEEGASGSPVGPGVHLVRAADGGAPLTPAYARALMEQLEEEFGLVVAELTALEDPITTALLSGERAVVLVGRTGRVVRSEVQEVVRALASAQVPTAGIVLVGSEQGRGTRVIGNAGRRNGAGRGDGDPRG